MGSAASVDRPGRQKSPLHEEPGEGEAPIIVGDDRNAPEQVTGARLAIRGVEAAGADSTASGADTQRQETSARDGATPNEVKHTENEPHTQPEPSFNAAVSARASPAPAVQEFLTNIRQFYESEQADANGSLQNNETRLQEQTGGDTAVAEEIESVQRPQPLRGHSTSLSFNARGSYALSFDVVEEVTGRTTPNSSAASSAAQSRNNSMTAEGGFLGGVSTVAVEKAVREAEQEHSRLLLREPTPEETNMDRDPINSHELLRSLRQIVFYCSSEAFERAVPAIEDLGLLDTFRRCFKRKCCSDLPWRNAYECKDSDVLAPYVFDSPGLAWPPDDESYLDTLHSKADFEKHHALHADSLQRPIAYLIRKKTARVERFRELRKRAQKEEWRSLGLIDGIRRYLFRLPNISSVCQALSDARDLVELRRHSRQQAQTLKTLSKRLNAQAAEAEEDVEEAIARVKVEEVVRLESGSSFVFHKGYHFELPDTEVLAATAEAAAADAAAKEQTAKTTARAARQAERAAVRSLRASTDAEFALDAATALSAAGRTHREVTGTFRAVRKAEMARATSSETSKKLYRPVELILSERHQSAQPSMWNQLVDSEARALFQQAAHAAGNMRVARGEAQRQAHFVLHNLAFTTAEVVDMLRDPKAEQVLRTKSQLIRALENGDDFDVDVQKEFEDQRLGAILEMGHEMVLEFHEEPLGVKVPNTLLSIPHVVVQSLESGQSLLGTCGIHPGDAIVAVNGTPVTSRKQLAAAVQKASCRLKIIRLKDMSHDTIMLRRAIRQVLEDVRQSTEVHAARLYKNERPSSGVFRVPVLDQHDLESESVGQDAESESVSRSLRASINTQTAAGAAAFSNADSTMLQIISTFDLDAVLTKVLDDEFFGRNCLPEVQVLAILAVDVMMTFHGLSEALKSGHVFGPNAFVQNVRVRMARLLKPLALGTSEGGSDGMNGNNLEEKPSPTVRAKATRNEEARTAVSAPTVHAERHGVPLLSDSSLDVLLKARHAPSASVNSAGEKMVVPHSRARLGQQSPYLSEHWPRDDFSSSRTLAADSLPQLSVSCHLVPVVADVVQAFLRASGDVQHALVRNNRTRAGDEPDIRTSLRCALRELDRIGRAVSNVELFLRAQRQPILQELAVALATASSHASETCRVAPLLLTAASIMQACARQLAAKGCADSTRSFLLNVSLQFDACCQARDWRMLQALVDIHGMLRFGVGRSGYDSDAEAKLCKVQARWRQRTAQRAFQTARQARDAELLQKLLNRHRDMDGELSHESIGTAATDFAKAIAPDQFNEIAGIVSETLRATSLLRGRNVSQDEFVKMYQAIIAPAILPNLVEVSGCSNDVVVPMDCVPSPTRAPGVRSRYSSSAQLSLKSGSDIPATDLAVNSSSVERLRRFIQMLHAQKLVELSETSPTEKDPSSGIPNVAVWDAYSENPAEAALQLRKLISWVSQKASAILHRAIAAYDVDQIGAVLTMCTEATVKERAAVQLEKTRFVAQRALQVDATMLKLNSVLTAWTPGVESVDVDGPSPHMRLALRSAPLPSSVRGTLQSRINSARRQIARQKKCPRSEFMHDPRPLRPATEQERLVDPHLELLQQLVDTESSFGNDLDEQLLLCVGRLLDVFALLWRVRDLEFDKKTGQPLAPQVAIWVSRGLGGLLKSTIVAIDHFVEISVFVPSRFPKLFGFLKACRTHVHIGLQAMALESKLRQFAYSAVCDLSAVVASVHRVDRDQAVARLLDRAALDIVRQRVTIFQRIKTNIQVLTRGLDSERSASRLRSLTDVLIPMSNPKPLKTKSLRLQLRRALEAGMSDSVIECGERCLRRFEYHAKVIGQLLGKGPDQFEWDTLTVVRRAAARNGCSHPALVDMENLARTRRHIEREYLSPSRFVPYSLAETFRTFIGNARAWLDRAKVFAWDDKDLHDIARPELNRFTVRLLVQECDTLLKQLMLERHCLAFAHSDCPYAAGYALSLCRWDHLRMDLAIHLQKALQRRCVQMFESVVQRALSMHDWPMLLTLRDYLGQLAESNSSATHSESLRGIVQAYLDKLTVTSLVDSHTLQSRGGFNGPVGQFSVDGDARAALFSPLAYVVVNAHAQKPSVSHEKGMSNSGNSVSEEEPSYPQNGPGFAVIVQAALTRRSGSFVHRPAENGINASTDCGRAGDSDASVSDNDTFDSWETGFTAASLAATTSAAPATVSSVSTSSACNPVYLHELMENSLQHSERTTAVNLPPMQPAGSGFDNSDTSPLSVASGQGAVHSHLEMVNRTGANHRQQRENEDIKIESMDTTDTVVLHAFLVRNTMTPAHGGRASERNLAVDIELTDSEDSDDDAHFGRADGSSRSARRVTAKPVPREEFEREPVLLPNFEVLASASCEVSSSTRGDSKLHLLIDNFRSDGDCHDVFVVVNTGAVANSTRDSHGSDLVVKLRVQLLSVTQTNMSLRKVPYTWNFHAVWSGKAPSVSSGGPRFARQSQGQQSLRTSRLLRKTLPLPADARVTPFPLHKLVVSKAWFDNPQLRVSVKSTSGPRQVQIVIVQKVRVKVLSYKAISGNAATRVENRDNSSRGGINNETTQSFRHSHRVSGSALSLTQDNLDSEDGLIHGGVRGTGCGMTICVNRPSLKFGSAATVAAHSAGQRFDTIFESASADGTTTTTVTAVASAAGAPLHVLRSAKTPAGRTRHAGLVEERKICTMVRIDTRPSAGCRSNTFTGSALFPLFVVPHARKSFPFEFEISILSTEELQVEEVRLLDRDLNPYGTVVSYDTH